MSAGSRDVETRSGERNRGAGSMIGRMAQAILGRPEPAPKDAPAGVRIRRGGLIPIVGGRFAGMAGPAAAVTLGGTIFVQRGVRLTDRLLRHELAHVAQWRRQPLTFPWRYVAGHVRHGYRENPFEIEAREAELAPLWPRDTNQERP
jgi:hypothetical protein